MADGCGVEVNAACESGNVTLKGSRAIINTDTTLNVADKRHQFLHVHYKYHTRAVRCTCIYLECSFHVMLRPDLCSISTAVSIKHVIRFVLDKMRSSVHISGKQPVVFHIHLSVCLPTKALDSHISQYQTI